MIGFLVGINSPASTDVRIDREQSQLAAARVHMASEAFGCGALPELQSAVYKVPTLVFLNLFTFMLGCGRKEFKSLCFSSAGD